MKNSNDQPVPWKPHALQRRGVQFLLARMGSGLLLKPGYGKTSIMLKVLQTLKQHKLMHCALVVAPLRPCYMVWPAELRKWADFKGLRWQVLHGSQKEQRLEQDADICIINPDGLQWLMSEGRMQRLNPDVLVIDESTKFRNTQTQRFKLLRPWLPRFARRHILTGTPTPKSYLDLFGQIYILDLGNALGQYITHYRANYFYPSGYMGYDWKLNQGAEKVIQRRIKPLVLSIEDDDVVKMPRLMPPNVIRVELPEKARSVYNQIEEELYALLEGDDEVLAANAAVASGKCAQAANGGLYVYDNGDFADDERRARRSVVLHNAKDEALADLVEQLQGAPLLVCYEYKHDLERIKQVLGKNTPHIGGGVAPKQCAAIEEQWNRGELSVLLAHPATAGHGLNLQHGGCRDVCFYNIPWDYELYDQFLRRVLRQGNRHASVMAHHIVATGTLDEAKMQAMRRRAARQSDLLKALRAYMRKRH